jgi:putative heme-binding domain-containing protein
VDWGQELARRILRESGDPSWSLRPHPSDPTAPSPWNIQRRSCRDGKSVAVISSLPYSGKRTEALTGILRSKPFAAPAKLSFWLCGHRGYPKQAAHDKNLVRLIHVQTGKELHRAFPPRNDIAQEITWNLSAVAGQDVQLEVVDGDQASAYAWLAITRIEPAVAKVSSFDKTNARAKALPQLAALLKVTAPIDLRDQLRPYLPPSPAPAPIAVSAEERARLDHLITARAAAFARAHPEASRGAALFAKHCASCHQISGKGALLGPQLDGIGARGVERLCQDILDPNRNVDSHFHITTLMLKDQSQITGFVRGESGAVILLIDAAGKEHRLQKSTIATKKSLPLSFMPPGFEKVLTESEFNDLLSWLLQQKAN